MAEVPFTPDASRTETERLVRDEERAGGRTSAGADERESAAEGDEKERAAVSLDSITFLFQVLMALALTNGAYIFVTGGNGDYALRPWNSFTLFGSLAFLTFIATLIPFAHANVLILKRAYMHGYGGKGLRPVTDFFLLFLEAGIFYALSHSLTHIDQDFLSFFYLAGAILGVDVVWALATFAFDPDRKGELLYALLNSATLAFGTLLIFSHVTHLRELLLLTLGTRTVLDYALTYQDLFPGAFRGHAKRGEATAGLIISALAMALIGIAALLRYTGVDATVQAFQPSIQLAGFVLAAVAWVMTLIQTAYAKQWLWLTGTVIYTIAIPLVGSELLVNPALRIVGLVLLVLTPLFTLIYSIVDLKP